MSGLANINGSLPDVFDQESSYTDMIQEYHTVNERKKADEKWLKDQKPMVMAVMQSLGKEKSDFGDVRVSVTTPDESKFDMEKVMDYVLKFHPDLGLTKLVIDEDNLAAAIDQGLVDLESLKDYAWMEKKGSPRLVVSAVKKK